MIDEEELGQVRIKDRKMLAGMPVEDIIKFRDTLQAALDLFEDETGHRVAICAVRWMVGTELLGLEPELRGEQADG